MTTSPSSRGRSSPAAESSSEHSTQQSLIRYAIGMTALAGMLLWAAYLVRDVLLLIYISGLLAIGVSPTVRLIERQKVLPVGTTRFPRWLAILVLYLMLLGTVVGIGLLVVPPLVTQARELWTAAPGMMNRALQFLVDKGIVDHPLTRLPRSCSRRLSPRAATRWGLS
jgi:predicted PurR-regulated permease PerM